ncbi:MAG TPA: Clp protease N-terminal domain-containing protein [Ramlibacter sp.]|nr:Clp protease N-terminal domain-containing protein [Ramlibacter sp.]
MFQMFMRKLQDVRTLSGLCTVAEEAARRLGGGAPGSEHFILAALELPDGTAARAFAELGLDAARFREALSAQRSDALASVGISASATQAVQSGSAPPAGPRPALYEAGPSGQSLVQRLADARSTRAGRSLLGADVLLAAAQENHTPASRAFRTLGIRSEQLVVAANRSIASAGGRGAA